MTTPVRPTRPATDVHPLMLGSQPHVVVDSADSPTAHLSSLIIAFSVLTRFHMTQ